MTGEDFCTWLPFRHLRFTRRWRFRIPFTFHVSRFIPLHVSRFSFWDHGLIVVANPLAAQGASCVTCEAGGELLY
ncbi:MAG: hypothetical protein NT167_27980, partial [Verrucomicrobia bacterium]|nr:hypothetical protein [Verrucomicrobiota bacterium]